MPIQHRLISDPDLHEPKGISSAPSNSVYHANGSGSGIWKAVDKNSLGIPSANVGDTVIIGNGDTLSTRNDFAFGGMIFSGNSSQYDFGAHAPIDSLERIWPIQGAGCPWQSLTTNTGILVSDGVLTAQRAGLYKYELDVVFHSWAPTDPINVIGPRLNSSGSMMAHRAAIAGAHVGAAPDVVSTGTATLTAYMQLSAGATLLPCFNRGQTSPSNLVVTSAMVALTMIRG